LRSEELDLYVADLRNIPQANDLDVVLIKQAAAGFFVRSKHPLLLQPQVQLADIVHYGVACVRLPDEVALGLGSRLGLSAGQRFPLALECDDLNLLKYIALSTDTVLAYPKSSAQNDVASGRLVPLVVADFAQVSANVGIVSLKGRSLSLMSQFAVDFLTDMAKAEAASAA
jgi:DNA-binding transcriptional LysR family regulator